MKKIFILAALSSGILAMTGCGGAEGNDPGRAYMPDMYYSRAYEAYGYNNQKEDHDLAKYNATFNGMPVSGTHARGEASAFAIEPGDSGYAKAAGFRNSWDTEQITPAQMKEAERLYLINCGICHGTKLDGNGPLWNNGDGPYPAKPRDLKEAYSVKLSNAQMYHVITYGKGQMGSYASQVNPQQRQWIIKYIRASQAPVASSDTTGTATPAAPATDTTATPATGGAQ